MALLALLVLSAGGAGATFLVRGRAALATGVAFVALGGCMVAAIALPESGSLTMGSIELSITPYARLWLVMAGAAFLAVELVALALGWQRNLPLAALGGFGATAVALTVTDPPAALLAATAAGALGLVATLGRPVAMPSLRVAADGLRVAATAGAAGLLAVAWIGGAPIFLSPGALTAGVLLMAAAVAVRLGAVPVHVPLARLVETAHLTAVPLAAAWLPAVFAVVGLGWVEQVVAPMNADLAGPRLLITLVAVTTVMAAGVVALLDDDLSRVLGYGLVADGGFVLMALSATDPGVWAAARTWLLCMALARTVMALASLGLQGAHGSRRSGELRGWLRRTPLLGAALAGAALVAVGVPGMLPFEARRSLAVLAVGEPLGWLVLTCGALPMVPLARLVWLGTRAPGTAVATGRSERPLKPPAPEAGWGAGPMARLRAVGGLVQATWRLDRMPIASGVTVSLALVALAIAVGFGGLAGAAAGPLPGAGP